MTRQFLVLMILVNVCAITENVAAQSYAITQSVVASGGGRQYLYAQRHNRAISFAAENNIFVPLAPEILINPND